MSYLLLVALIFSSCLVFWGAISEARDEMRCTRLFIKERFGYEVTNEDLASFRPLPRWMEIIDTIVSPRKFLRMARRVWAAASTGFRAGCEHFASSQPVPTAETMVPFPQAVPMSASELGLTNIRAGTELVSEEVQIPA